MANQLSQLTVRLRDDVSGPAHKAARSLKNLEMKAGSLSRIGSTAGGLGGTAVALGGTTLGLFSLGRALHSTITKTADLDRRMTRLRVTSGASSDQTDAATESLKKLAVETALPFDKVTEGLETLVAQGRSLGDGMSMIGAIARTAQASGSEVEDIAKTADSVGTNFKIAGAQMQTAFDIMVEGGKAGQFELKDMARYLPSLAPAAAAIGLKGAAGLEQMVAMLQVVRKGTGTTEEAAASMGNIFQKMESDETAKKFGKFGIDLRKEMAKARKSGRNLLEVFEQLSLKAVGGDLSKLPQLFTDAEFARGMRAILTYRGEWQKLQSEIRTNAPGSALRDFNLVAQGARAEIDRLSEAWGNLQTRVGKKIDPAVTGLLRSVREQIDGTAIPKVSDLPVVRPGLNPPTGSTMDRLRGPAPGSGGHRSRERPGFVLDPELQSTRQFMNNLAEGMKAQRAGQAPGTSVSSGAKYVDQVSVPSMIEEMRERAAAAGGVTAGQSIRQQMADEAELKRLSDRHIAAKQAEADRTGPGPSPIEEMELRRKVPEIVSRIMQHEAAREGKPAPDQAAVGGRVDETFRQIESGAQSAQQALQSLDVTVAPTIDVSSIHAALEAVKALNAELKQVGSNTNRAASAAQASTTSMSLGQQFSSRRNGSFADYEHS